MAIKDLKQITSLGGGANPSLQKLANEGGGTTPTPVATTSQTSPNDVEQVNLSELAGGKNGSLEIQKYLYETGLQNIFNNYNKQIANLDSSKQKEVEDAYYVRELSKKYLGEYASNAGIGDVSGQLLDIYGQYQTNINEINANFNELSLGLESSYNETKNEYEMGLLQTQAQIEQADNAQQLEKDLAEINYNIGLGLYPDGMNVEDYLDSVRDKIGETNYWSMMAENKVVEMSNTVNSALKNTNQYANQGEWDNYVDGLLTNKSINKQQADYLKGMYEVEQNTNFTKNNNVNINNDIAYYNPNNRNIISKGNVYESRNGEYILAETNNAIDSSSSLYSELDEKGKELAFDTPFGHNGKWFVKEMKNGEQVYTEYAKSTNYNKLTNSSSVSSSNANQKEIYDAIHKELGGKSGSIETSSGMIAYTYDSEKDEYSPYLDFQASNVGDEKGDFNINGVRYYINKKDPVNGGSGMADLKDDFKEGTWKKGKDKEPQKSIANEMAKVYFGGDFGSFVNYVENSRSWGVNQIKNSNALVVEYEGAYYTINDGELWKLSKK